MQQQKSLALVALLVLLGLTVSGCCFNLKSDEPPVSEANDITPAQPATLQPDANNGTASPIIPFSFDRGWGQLFYYREGRA